jgi:hypothetical protein
LRFLQLPRSKRPCRRHSGRKDPQLAPGSPSVSAVMNSTREEQPYRTKLVPLYAGAIAEVIDNSRLTTDPDQLLSRLLARL